VTIKFLIYINEKNLELFWLLNLERMSTIQEKKIPQNYYCDLCHFNTSKKLNYELHLQTIKHLRNNSQQLSTNLIHSCNNCNKIYKDRT
jgi:hypothetical protein